jgi:hypothetical protein
MNFTFLEITTLALSLISLFITTMTVSLILQKKALVKRDELKENLTERLSVMYATSAFQSTIGKSLDIALNRNSYRLLHVKSKDLKKKYNAALQKLDEETIKKEEKKSLVLTSLIIKHTSKSNTLAYIVLMGSLIFYLLGTYLGVLEKGILVPSLAITLILIVFLRQQILVHRIKHRKYGSNEYEVREMLNFILDESNKHYFNGSNGKPVILNEENLMEIKQSVKDLSGGGIRV